MARLTRFVSLLGKWQTQHNLVGSGTLDEVWSRHVADSLQLIDHAPKGPCRWLDLGSGAGFPGLMIAIAAGDREPIDVTLVESNRKKCAFLRAAARACDIDVEIAAERIEEHGKRQEKAYDVISARALAPLPRLLELALPFCTGSNQLVLHKGRDFEQEDRKAAIEWNYEAATFQSRTDAQGKIVVLRHVGRRESRV